MTGWWDKQAAHLQQMGQATEREQVQAGITYDDETVRLAIVHTRQDVVLMCSYLSSINRQIATLKVIALIVAAAAVYIAFRLSY